MSRQKHNWATTTGMSASLFAAAKENAAPAWPSFCLAFKVFLPGIGTEGHAGGATNAKSELSLFSSHTEGGE